MQDLNQEENSQRFLASKTKVLCSVTVLNQTQFLPDIFAIGTSSIGMKLAIV